MQKHHKTKDDAMNSVASSLGLSSDDIKKDPIASNNEKAFKANLALYNSALMVATNSDKNVTNAYKIFADTIENHKSVSSMQQIVTNSSIDSQLQSNIIDFVVLPIENKQDITGSDRVTMENDIVGNIDMWCSSKNHTTPWKWAHDKTKEIHETPTK